MMFLIVIFLSIIFSNTQKPPKFLPNLQMGEFVIIFDTACPCESTKSHEIAVNVYFSKRSLNVTEVKGNITMTIPFDNTLQVDMNLASWGLQGGWNENAMVYKTNNACSTLGNLFDEIAPILVKSTGIQTYQCPIPPGTYILKGIDVNEFRKNNLPKIFFYGKYKLTVKIKNNKEKLLGCLASQMRFVRPWEVPNN